MTGYILPIAKYDNVYIYFHVLECVDTNYYVTISADPIYCDSEFSIISANEQKDIEYSQIDSSTLFRKLLKILFEQAIINVTASKNNSLILDELDTHVLYDVCMAYTNKLITFENAINRIVETYNKILKGVYFHE